MAVTVWLLLRVIAQGAVPEQPAPLQPTKVLPEAAVALTVTTVPDGYVAQPGPQLVPAGLVATVPCRCRR